MAKFTVTSPDGNDYHVDAPDGSTEQDAIAHVQQRYSKPALQAHATAMAKKHGIPPEYLHSLIKHESNWNTHATSEVGAHGLTQLMEPTAKEVGVDRKDVYANVEGGAKYLAKQFNRFGTPEKALSAYHSGGARVIKANGIPPGARVNKYVPDVISHANYLRMNPKEMGEEMPAQSDDKLTMSMELAGEGNSDPVEKPQNVWGLTPDMLGGDIKGMATRLGLGAASLPLGAAQLAANVVAPDTAGKYMNKQLADIEKMKGQDGFDWAGLAGGLGTGVGALRMAPKVLSSVAPSLLGKVGQGAVIGAGGAAATPVTTGGTDFMDEKAKQAAMGLILGGSLPGMFNLGGNVSNRIFNFGKSFTNKGRDVVAGRNLADAIGPNNVPAAQAMLRQYKPVVRGSNATVGEILSPLNRPEVSGMEKVASAFNPSAYAKNELKKKSAQFEQLAKLSGGTSQTAAMEAANTSKKQLGDTVGARMGVALDEANVGAQIPRLEADMSAKYKQMASALQDSGQMYTTAQQMTNKLREQSQSKYAGFFNKNTVDKKISDIGNARQGVLDAMDVKKFRQLEGDNLAAKAKELVDAGYSPLDTSKLSAFIQNKISEPGTRVSGKERDVLEHVSNKIQEAVEQGGGIANAKDLHEIRKNAINEKVADLLGSSDPKASARMSAQMLSTIKPHIDDAIEAAGGKGWKEALLDYERGMHNVSRQKMAAKAQSLLSASPNKLVSLSKGDEPKMVEKVFGPGKFNLSTQMGDLTGGITQVGDELSATAANKDLASEGLQWANKKLGTMVPEIPSTGIFDPRLSMMRGVINRAAGRADNKIIENLADVMTNNPKEAARLLDMYQLSPEQKSQLFNFMLNNKVMRVAPGIASGQLVNQQ